MLETFSVDLISTWPPCSGSSIISLCYSMCSKKALISYMLWEVLKGSSLSLISREDSSCWPFFPLAGAFAGGAFPAACFPFAPANFCSSSLCLLVNLGSLSSSTSYGVNSSPPSLLSCKKYFFLAFFARSARPGSLSSQDFFNSFSASSLDVSRIIIMLSEEKVRKTQIKSLVSSFKVLHSGQSLKSNEACK